MFAHPVYIGNWPEQMIQIVDERSKLEGFSTSRLPKFTDEEVALIKGTSDFYSLNTLVFFLLGWLRLIFVLSVLHLLCHIHNFDLWVLDPW